jgi:hypothetical protein
LGAGGDWSGGQLLLCEEEGQAASGIESIHRFIAYNDL